jgi:hypothetical protein
MSNPPIPMSDREAAEALLSLSSGRPSHPSNYYAGNLTAFATADNDVQMVDAPSQSTQPTPNIVAPSQTSSQPTPNVVAPSQTVPTAPVINAPSTSANQPVLAKL